jgi:hypothetical protein
LRQAGFALADHQCGVSNINWFPQDTLDFGRVDTITAELDLLILSADVLEQTIRPEATKITRLENSRLRIERIYRKGLDGQVGITPICQREIAARYDKFTDFTVRHRATVIVEQHYNPVGHATPDR